MVQNYSQEIVQRTELFAWQVEQLRFSGDFYIYNPLQYAWKMHEAYLRTYLAHPVKTLMLGMNPPDLLAWLKTVSLLVRWML